MLTGSLHRQRELPNIDQAKWLNAQIGILA
jgi:hypothetical protein